jgi:deoxyribonuclease-4
VHGGHLNADDDIADRVRGITGRIDLVHANNSRDAFDSGADRHANLASGQIDSDVVAGIARDAACDVVVETPREGHADDIEFLRKMI